MTTLRQLYSTFGSDTIEDLSPLEASLLRRDVRAIVTDESRTVLDACRTLHSRIGGAVNLKSYVAALVAGFNHHG